MSHHLHTVVLYHAKCLDGFGAAYAAWKKFGDNAEYIPVKHGGSIPEHMDGREIFFVDFCFPEEQMKELASVAQSITILDHHESVSEIVAKYPGVFDASRSGATIAWKYFHSDTPTPSLLTHIEDGDLYRYQLPDTRDLFSYLLVQHHDFETWEQLVTDFEDTNKREAILTKARIYTEYFIALAESCIASAKLVSFEGYECYFANSHPSMSMKSYIGNQLAKKQAPLALIVSAHPDGFGVSIRGDGSVNVSDIAQKFGGKGHPNSAGFFIPTGSPIPWTEINPA